MATRKPASRVHRKPVRTAQLQPTAGRTAAGRPALRPVRWRRDREATEKRILEAARREFAEHGYSGGRVQRIARLAKSNVQLLYQYFGSKEDLYVMVLEDSYARVRALERNLALDGYAPLDGMRRLIEFTFDYLLDEPTFVAIIRNENVAGGRFIRRSRTVPKLTMPLVAAIGDLLKRGRRTGVFKRDVDPTHLYVTILGLSITHLSNQHTLSVMFDRDMTAGTWLKDRRQHAVEVILSYLVSGFYDAASVSPKTNVGS
jgi:AcrR family transcriptional regulator